MNQKRIKQLLEFKEENPRDPFIIYALATEHKVEMPEEAKKLFDLLLADFPDYIGTYYHAAALYAEHFDRDIAEKIFKNGIEIAEKNNEQHALKELKNAYTNFLFEE